LNKYERFWNFFSDHQENFFHQLEEHVDDYILLIQEQLEMVNEHLAFEISELLDSNKREFIISADGMQCAFEDVLLLGEYQRDYQHWIITLFRQPEHTSKHSIELDDLVLSYDDIFYLNLQESSFFKDIDNIVSGG
jgi:hypothetical protein